MEEWVEVWKPRQPSPAAVPEGLREACLELAEAPQRARLAAEAPHRPFEAVC